MTAQTGILGEMSALGPMAVCCVLVVMAACGGGGAGETASAAQPAAGSGGQDGVVGGAYYVSPSGDDAAAGTLDAPWRTLAHAAATLTAGATVYLRQGTYAERLAPTISGRAGAPITYSAYPGEQATIDGQGAALPAGWGGLVEVANVSHIELVGLRVVNAGPDDNHAGILVDGSSHVTVRGCSTSNTASSGIGVWNSSNVVIDANEVTLACVGGEQECITVAVTDAFEVTGNHVHDTGPSSKGGEGIDVKDGSTNGVVSGNTVHDIDRLGFYVDAWDKPTFNIRVHSNVAYRCAGSGFAVASENGGLLQDIMLYNNIAYENLYSGIMVGGWGEPGAAHPMTAIYLVNNTLYGNGTSGWGPGITLENPEADRVIVLNNLLARNASGQMELGAAPRDLVVEHNLFFGEGDPVGTNAVQGDPLCVHPAGADFHLQAGSRAIDAGTSVDAPDADFEGTSRPQGAAPDIGAYEHAP